MPSWKIVGLTDSQMRFVTKRQKLLRVWFALGPLLLVALTSLGAWLYRRQPLLINPFAVASGLESGTIEDSTLFLMALLLPILMLSLLVLIALMVILMYGAFSNEKKFIAIIRTRLDQAKDDQPEDA